MLRSSPLFGFLAVVSLIAHFFVLRYAAAAAATVPQLPASNLANGDSTMGARSDNKDISNSNSNGWAEIIGLLTVAQADPLPTLYTFLVNEHDGNDAFVRQSGCFQVAEFPGDLAGYKVGQAVTTTTPVYGNYLYRTQRVLSLHYHPYT